MGDKLQWGSRSINISKINIRKQHKSDPMKSLSWPKCLFPNLIPRKQSLNYLIPLPTDEALEGNLRNSHFHFYSQTLDFIIKERSPCFSRFSMHFSSPVRTLPLVSIPSFPKCEFQFAFNCITLDLVFLALCMFFLFLLYFEIYILIRYQDTGYREACWLK